MTREFKQRIECPYCGNSHTVETAVSRWIRNHPDLKSNEQGITLLDQDLWIHKFKTAKDGRELQCIMLVEIKTNLAEPSPSQKDDLFIIDQILRNRKQTPTKKLTRQAGNAPLKVFSTINNRLINLRCFGVHLLRIAGNDIEHAIEIIWDKTKIDIRQLINILRFDLDPDTLRPIDFRRHHYKEAALLFDITPPLER